MFDFSYLKGIAVEERFIVGGIDASQFTSVEAWLRLHDMNIGGVNGDPSGAGKVTFDLFVEGDTPDDPSQSFLADAGGNGITIDMQRPHPGSVAG